MKRMKPTRQDFDAAFNTWSDASIEYWRLAQARFDRASIDEDAAEAIEERFNYTHQKLVELVQAL